MTQRRLQEYMFRRFPQETNNYQQFSQVYLTPFCFQEWSKKTQNKNSVFLSWFVGFSEADGCFKIGQDGGKLRLYFSISQKEKHILDFIQLHLGFGNVSRDSENKDIYRFQCSSKQDIHSLILLFNGNLILKKTTQKFEKWVTLYNLLNSTNIKVVSRWSQASTHHSQCFDHVFCTIHSVLFQTPWLSGFIDGESCFSASPQFTKLTSFCKLNASFSIKQNFEPEFMVHLYVLLNGGSVIREKNQKIFIYQSSGKNPLAVLENYLKTSKLLTRKIWCLLLWNFIRNWIHSKQGKCSELEFQSVQRLATRINSHEIHFFRV